MIDQDNIPPCVYRISVKALIKNDSGRILLIREKDNGWELPGGGLEHGEEPRAGLERELQEEIGVELESVSSQPAGFWTLSTDNGPRWYAIVLYEVKINGQPQPGEEAEEIQYFSEAEISNLQLHKNTKPYFDQA